MSKLSSVLVTFEPPGGRNNGGAVFTESVAAILEEGGCRFDRLSYYECAGLKGKFIRKLSAFLQMLLFRRPLMVGYFYSSKLSHRVLILIGRIIDESTEAPWIYIDHLELMYLTPRIRGRFGDRVKIAHVSHNREPQLLLERTESSSFGKLFEQIAPYGQFERRTLALCDRILSISEEDAKHYRLLATCASDSVVVVPPTFSYAAPARPAIPLWNDGKYKLVFLANMDWWPNVMALEWLIGKLCPVLDDRFLLHVYGKGSERYAGSAHAVFHGFVKDIAEVWDGCFASLAPITKGGGVNIKVAESLHNKVPVIATEIALRGLSPEFTGGSLCLEPDPQLWARHLLELSNDLGTYEHMIQRCNYPGKEEVLELIRK